jgi:hypothetical protein
MRPFRATTIMHAQPIRATLRLVVSTVSFLVTMETRAQQMGAIRRLVALT